MAFLVFEGIDGAGKSTLINKLAEELRRQRLDFVMTREPGGTALGEALRPFLLRQGDEAPCPRAELLLYEAIRAQHVDGLIRPALKRGQWVLCDRFSASTLAFQVGGRRLERTKIDWLNAFATDQTEPDLYVLLDLDPSVSAARLKKRQAQGQKMDRFEQEDVEFHKRVRDYYLQLAKEDPNGWLLLDAENTPEVLFAQLLARVKENQWWPS